MPRSYGYRQDVSDHETAAGAWSGVGRALVALAFSAYIGVLVIGDRTTATTAAVLYVIVVVASIVLHEIAHAVVAMAVGAEVTGMRFGFGPRLTPASSPFDLRPLVVAGHVSYRPPRGAGRWRLLAITSAGLWVHVALVVAALSLGGGAWPAWRIALLVANAYALLGNALPMVGSFTTTAGGPNDGASIVLLLRQRGAYLSPADPDVTEVVSAYERGGVPAAQAVLSRLDRQDLPLLRIRIAQMALAGGRYADARALVRGGVDPGRPWLGAYVFATAEAMTLVTGGGESPERIAAADTAADAALRSMPAGVAGTERSAALQTMALVRLLQERWDEAAHLASWAFSLATEPASRAAALATQGWAVLGLGRRSDAERLLAHAMTLNNGPLPRALARRLAATPVSS